MKMPIISKYAILFIYLFALTTLYILLHGTNAGRCKHKQTCRRVNMTKFFTGRGLLP